jgi:hypothetical protein
MSVLLNLHSFKLISQLKQYDLIRTGDLQTCIINQNTRILEICNKKRKD